MSKQMFVEGNYFKRLYMHLNYLLCTEKKFSSEDKF